jgi:hypothetical protein
MKLKNGIMRHKIFIEDNVFKHGLYIQNPAPIARKSKYMDWDFNPPKDDDKSKIVYTDNSLNLARKNSKNNICWMIESPEYHRRIYNEIKNNNSLFKYILTHNRELLNLDKKFIFAPMGGSWLYDDEFGIHKKTKSFSIIASWKRELVGHALRHQIVNASKGKIDVFGNGYNPVKNKITALKEYRYTFCIENCKEDYYFTEKLIDSFLSGTIPIYWGCPSIGDFFNLKGMVIFDNLLELKDKLKLCTESFYLDNMDAIIDNYNRAFKYLIPEDYIFENKKEYLYN